MHLIALTDLDMLDSGSNPVCRYCTVINWFAATNFKTKPFFSENIKTNAGYTHYFVKSYIQTSFTEISQTLSCTKVKIQFVNRTF